MRPPALGKAQGTLQLRAANLHTRRSRRRRFPVWTKHSEETPSRARDSQISVRTAKPRLAVAAVPGLPGDALLLPPAKPSYLQTANDLYWGVLASVKSIYQLRQTLLLRCRNNCQEGVMHLLLPGAAALSQAPKIPWPRTATGSLFGASPKPSSLIGRRRNSFVAGSMPRPFRGSRTRGRASPRRSIRWEFSRPESYVEESYFGWCARRLLRPVLEHFLGVVVHHARLVPQHLQIRVLQQLLAAVP